MTPSEHLCDLHPFHSAPATLASRLQTHAYLCAFAYALPTALKVSPQHWPSLWLYFVQAEDHMLQL